MIYLLNWKKRNDKCNIRSRNFVIWIICIITMLLIRCLENRVSLHIVYDYLTIFAMALVIGYFLVGYNFQYTFIVSLIFLLILTLAQFLGCVLIYIKNRQKVIYQLSSPYQIELLLIIELIFVFGIILARTVIRRIPISVPSVSLVTITIPLVINIAIMAVGADWMYYDSSLKIITLESLITILLLCIAMVVGNVANLIFL